MERTSARCTTWPASPFQKVLCHSRLSDDNGYVNVLMSPVSTRLQVTGSHKAVGTWNAEAPSLPSEMSSTNHTSRGGVGGEAWVLCSTHEPLTCILFCFYRGCIKSESGSNWSYRPELGLSGQSHVWPSLFRSRLEVSCEDPDSKTARLLQHKGKV